MSDGSDHELLNQNFDLIIIGSGVGAICAGSLLSKWGNKKVLVLEQHDKIGGLSHSFSRHKKYEWNVGCHYVGDLDGSSLIRRIFDVASGKKLNWRRLPAGSLVFKYRDCNFIWPESEVDYKQMLVKLFPKMQKSLEIYFQDIQIVNEWANQKNAMATWPSHLTWLISPIDSRAELIARMGLKEYFDSLYFSNELQELLESHWGSFGLVGNECPFVTHAIFTRHYLGGLFLPVGGGSQIGEKISQAITERQGVIKTSMLVKKILVSKNQVTGVEVFDRKKKINFVLKCENIISNAGILNTYQNLIDHKNDFDLRELENIEEKSMSGVSLFLGLKENPEKVGLDKNFYWIFDRKSHASAKLQINNSGGRQVLAAGISISQSIKNQQYSAQIFFPVLNQYYSKWKNSKLTERPSDYLNFKKELTTQILSFVESHFSGFTKLVSFAELGTPLSFSHYTSQPSGLIYGLALTKERIASNLFNPKSSISGLYFSGADVAYPGIAGAALGGALCVSSILGIQAFRKIFTPGGAPG